LSIAAGLRNRNEVAASGLTLPSSSAISAPKISSSTSSSTARIATNGKSARGGSESYCGGFHVHGDRAGAFFGASFLGAGGEHAMRG